MGSAYRFPPSPLRILTDFSSRGRFGGAWDKLSHPTSLIILYSNKRMVNYPTHKNCSKKSSRPNPLTSHIPQSQIQISKETIVPGKQKIHKLLLNHEQLFRATNICRIISFANSSLHPMASARDLAKRALVALVKKGESERA